MQANQSFRSGFTFIEMVIAILVMGILSAVAVPNYVTAIAKYRADLAARKIVADLHYAKSEAQRTSQSRTVHFYSVENRYILEDVVDIDHPDLPHTVVELVNDPFSATIVSVDFDGDSAVIFDMYGRPDSIGTVDIQSGNVLRTVTLAADGTASK